MSNPSENPPPNPPSQDDDVLTVEVVSPRKGKGKGKPKTTILQTYSLRSSDRQRLLEPSTSESLSSDRASAAGFDTEIDETEIETDPSSKHSNISRKVSSNPSSSPSVAFPFEDVDESPSIKKRIKLDEDQISNVSDHPIDIEMDYGVNVPVAGPSGLQEPVASPLLIVPGDVRAGTAASISSAASLTTYSIPERPVKTQMPSPTPPLIDNYLEVIYTVSKYMTYFMCCVQLFSSFVSIFLPRLFGFQSQTAMLYMIFTFFAFMTVFFGLFIGQIAFVAASFFGYIAILVAVGSEFNVLHSLWGMIIIALLIFIAIYVFTEVRYRPRDLVYEYQSYRRAISCHELVDPGDGEGAYELPMFPATGPIRQADEQPESIDTIRPSSRGFDPIDSSRGANVVTAIIEVTREDDSGDLLSEYPTADPDSSGQHETAL